MTKPEGIDQKRIQRRRERGWRMPEGAVYVGRPTRWGNPFHAQDFLMFGKPDQDGYSHWCLDFQSDQSALNCSIELYEDIARGFWNPSKVSSLSDRQYAALYADVTAWRERLSGHPLEHVRIELRGKDLVCWCPLGSPCHADVLLRLANPGGSVGEVHP